MEVEVPSGVASAPTGRGVAAESPRAPWGQKAVNNAT